MNTIDHPSHYNAHRYEAIDVIEDWELNFSLGNTVKYICRAGHKGDAIEDLEKAAWYLRREIDRRKHESGKVNGYQITMADILGAGDDIDDGK